MDSLERFEAPGGRPVRIAKPIEGRIQRGRFIGYASGASADRLAVIDNGREVLALATSSSDLKTGAQVHAAVAREQNRLVWRVDELERKLTTIELKDEQGRPCPQQRYILVFADGREQSGFLDETGRAELLLEEGATIRFPGMIDVAKGAAQ